MRAEWNHEYGEDMDEDEAGVDKTSSSTKKEKKVK